MAKEECCGCDSSELMALNEPGLLYIIQEGHTDEYYKVGVSKDQDSLKSRVQNLQSGNWRTLYLKQASKVKNMNLAEKFAHTKLKDYNIDAGGGKEWFKAPYKTVKAAVDEAAREYPPQ